MNNAMRIVIVTALALAVSAVFALKERERSAASGQNDQSSAPSASSPAAQPVPLPRLVDLGAGKCIPCRMMAPILEEMKKEYAGRLHVEFIDVWENRGAGEKYGITSIPTQIFYDASGKELARHEGFISKADILAKWKELGVTLAAAKPAAPK